MIRADLIIKICGITRVEDGMAALGAGADWLGFIRWPKSPRWRADQEMARIIRELRERAPKPFQAVGVYVDSPVDDIERDAERLGLDRVQLHGDESPEVAAALSRPAIKVIRVRDAESLRRADDFPGIDLLADTFDPALPGGTGRGYDYGLLRELAARRRVIIAGGLTPENVGAVVASLMPFGVDVSSGVESEPGVKDHARIISFIQAARAGAAGASS
ncbi:phosphoribosylanthranilate isomerase [bacterium]|nr:phosphoribosylanthranilate isomerase [bacterium]